jgi:hypothetical protein
MDDDSRGASERRPGNGESGPQAAFTLSSETIQTERRRLAAMKPTRPSPPSIMA